MIKLILLPLLVFLFVLIGGLLAITHLQPKQLGTTDVMTASVPPKPVYTHDPELAAMTNRLGMDISELNLVLGRSPLEAPTNQGLFDGVHTIYVSPGLGQLATDRIMSHEYIHYIQTTQVVASKSFYPYLESLYNNDTWFYNRMAFYRTCTTCALDKELEAVACTEFSALRSDFADFCNKYLPKRNELF